MQLERLGVIVFFGMIVPGAFLTATILLAFACFLEVGGIHGHAEMFSFIGKGLVLSTTAFFFFSYLLGVVLRLFAPNLIDKASTYYLRFFRRMSKDNPNNAWVYDVFPYRETLESLMNRHGMKNVSACIESLNKEYGRKGNTFFFGYCKLLIEANNETLAKHVQQAEALVRFLSGTALALMMAALTGTVFTIIFGFQHKPIFFHIYLGISVVCWLALAGILARFKFQRRREVLLVWQSVYLLLKGSIPNSLGLSPAELTNRVRLNLVDEAQCPGNSPDAQSNSVSRKVGLTAASSDSDPESELVQQCLVESEAEEQRQREKAESKQ